MIEDYRTVGLLLGFVELSKEQQSASERIRMYQHDCNWVIQRSKKKQEQVQVIINTLLDFVKGRHKTKNVKMWKD